MKNSKKEVIGSHDFSVGSITRNANEVSSAKASGSYLVRCFDKDGRLKWEDTIENQVTVEGAKLALDTLMVGSANTTVFIGLISSVGWTAVAVGDTAAQINGTNAWKEAGSSTNFPLTSGSLRLAPSFSAATGAASPVSKTHTAVGFSIVTTGGTVKGCFLILNGTSAVANTTGKLYSAGTFTGGDKTVSIGDTLNVTYTAQMTF